MQTCDGSKKNEYTQIVNHKYNLVSPFNILFMWLGHFIAGLIISVFFSFDLATISVCMFFSWLPNSDAILVKLGLAGKEFHTGPTHSLVFSLFIGLVVSIFSLKYGFIAFLCSFTHLICDLPVNTGIDFLYPFKKRKVSLNLWKDTGFWERKSIIGYYKQKWAKILELLLFLLFIILLTLKEVF